MKTMGMRRAALAVAAGAMTWSAWATDGYFSHGYGMRAVGMGGASSAVAGDAFAGANNPASLVAGSDQLQLGVNWFRPERSADRAGGVLAPLDGHVDSGSPDFLIPELAYGRHVRSDLALGVAVYGNGGMNTDYPQGPFACPNASFQFGPANMLCGSGKLGVDLMQLMVAPTASWQFAPGQSLGIAPQLAWQRFKLDGAQLFAINSTDPAHVSNTGYDTSTGIGVRLGYRGQLGEHLAFGAAYAPKTRMSAFSHYAGLFADHGRFDLPGNWTVGLAFSGVAGQPGWLLAADFKRILYSQVGAVGNPSTQFFVAPLGSPNGAGFGWSDVSVVKLGSEWRLDPAWTLRAGYSHSDSPIQARDVTFNILAPGLVQDHYTFGFTRSLSAGSELTMAFLHAPGRSVTGASLMNPLFQAQGAPANAAGQETIRLREDSLGLAWNWRL